MARQSGDYNLQYSFSFNNSLHIKMVVRGTAQGKLASPACQDAIACSLRLLGSENLNFCRHYLTEFLVHHAALHDINKLRTPHLH